MDSIISSSAQVREVRNGLFRIYLNIDDSVKKDGEENIIKFQLCGRNPVVRFKS